MGDNTSYDENVEVQETNLGSGGGVNDGGGGDGGGDGGRGDFLPPSYSRNYHSRHRVKVGGGGAYYGGGGSSEVTIAQGVKAFFIAAGCLAGMTIIWLLFFNNDHTTPKPSPPSPPKKPPPPPKPWSGNFTGHYLKVDDGAFSADTWRWSGRVLQYMASLDGDMLITTEATKEGKNSSIKTIYKVHKPLDGLPKRVDFNFTSGVRFRQPTTRQGKVWSTDTDGDYSIVEVPTTITVEQWAEDGKKGVWREVQHSSPEIKVKRIFFDDEMTAIYQGKEEDYNKEKVYVVRYRRERHWHG